MNITPGLAGSAFTGVVPVKCAGPSPVAVVAALWGVAVHDVLFVLLIIGMFGFLALCAKGADKL